MHGRVERKSLLLPVEDEAFRQRMESQCEQIELYRQRILHDGDRILTLDEAAHEWIARYAAAFVHCPEPVAE